MTASNCDCGEQVCVCELDSVGVRIKCTSCKKLTNRIAELEHRNARLTTALEYYRRDGADDYEVADKALSSTSADTEAWLRAEIMKRLIPFGVWHQGSTEDESDFFLGDAVAAKDCEHCIQLYRLPEQLATPEE